MTKVLVVDDTPDMARLIAHAVKLQGYDALTALDGREALDLAAAEQPDVILLDVMMPGMSGLEVLRRLKADAELRVVPVILVTAMADEGDVVRGLDAGAQDYVTKPFQREILVARLRTAVRSRESQDRLRRLNERLKSEIEERRRMEYELARAQKLESIGHLAAGIAHEINTPAQYVGDNTRFLREAFADVDKLLGKLNLLIDSAKRGEVNDELVAETEDAVRQTDLDYLREEIPAAIRQSLEGIERVGDIVRAMKEFSHPGGDQKQATDLNHAIESTLTVSRNEWKYVADLETDFDPSLPPVPCLVGDFNQAILNLVVNAAQAISEAVGDGTRGKGTIVVRTRRDGDWAEIQVEDTGTGIPDTIREKVFDHFFTTKDVGKGTGQGLAIAHDVIVQKHGGTMRFQTEMGKGTTFFVRLPIEEDGHPKETIPEEITEAAC
jgi:signal transduction histidine kinase